MRSTFFVKIALKFKKKPILRYDFYLLFLLIRKTKKKLLNKK